MTMAGLEYYLIPAVRFSPNVQYVTYGTPESANIPKPKNELAWRATFYWTW